VKQRLLDKVVAAKDPEIFLQRAADAEWIDTEFTGIQVRVLFVDRKRNLQTLILRAGPGVSFPDHLHLGPEEGLLLEGDLSSGGHLLTAGDYIRFKEGSRHGPSRTETGCMLLTMSVIDPIQT
jgi:anti-sigma factor ChrR (cupin superfamily)